MDNNNAGLAKSRPRQGLWFLAVLSTLLAFASISTDLYLPAMPAMAVELGASENVLLWTVSSYLFGFGFGQLAWGPISDRHGRKAPVFFGVLVFVIGSAGCAMSQDVWQVIGWRVVQALGASAGVALARAMVRDLYERDEAARILSYLVTAMAIAPLLGPSVGAQILLFASWQTIFWTLVGIGILTAFAIITLPETLPVGERVSIAPRDLVRGYADLLGNRQLVGYACAIGFFNLAIFANIAGAPFVYIEFYGISPQAYALIFASKVFGLMLANTANAKLVVRYGTRRMLAVGSIGASLFGGLLLCLTLTGWGGIYLLTVGIVLFGAMNGLILANAIAGALATVSTRAGAASALMGAAQYGSGMIGASLVGILANGTPWPMGAVMALGGVGCLVSYLAVSRYAS